MIITLIAISNIFLYYCFFPKHVLLPITYLTEGTRIFFTSWKNRLRPKKYPGNAEEICKKVVDDCWNGRFFQTSTGNFAQFWTRDFGWCASSLVKLGYQMEVQHSLRYALNRFRKAKRVTTTITPGGKPYDFPNEAVDSLPWFIHALRVSKFSYYDYKDFLNLQINKYFNRFIDKQTGLVRTDQYFSSIKDFAVRKSSCYDNCLVGMLAKDLKTMKLFNPFQKYDYAKLIKNNFWNGSYFYDDLDQKDYVAGDANIFPFVCGLISDKEMISSVINAIKKEALDYPFPLKYTDNRKQVKFIWQEIFFFDYESDALWMHLGLLYVKLVQQADQKLAEKYKKEYAKIIEKQQNFMEVFSSAGKPYHSPFYYCDSGMLWAANYLTL